MRGNTIRITVPTTLWAKGQSGNPNGRPKGSEGLCTYIKRKTRDCYRLADLMIAIAEDVNVEPRDRISAIRWLADRSLGKVQEQASEVDKFKLIQGMLSVPRVETKLEAEKIDSPTQTTN